MRCKVRQKLLWTLEQSQKDGCKLFGRRVRDLARWDDKSGHRSRTRHRTEQNVILCPSVIWLWSVFSRGRLQIGDSEGDGDEGGTVKVNTGVRTRCTGAKCTDAANCSCCCCYALPKKIAFSRACLVFDPQRNGQITFTLATQEPFPFGAAGTPPCSKR